MDNDQIRKAVNELGDALVQKNMSRNLNPEEQKAYRNIVDLVGNVLCNLNDIAYSLNNIEAGGRGR